MVANLTTMAVVTTTTTVLKLMKEKFHHCLSMCKSLDYQVILSSVAGKKALELIAPDKIIYDYAIEMCQTAALEEMFGHTEEVSELVFRIGCLSRSHLFCRDLTSSISIYYYLIELTTIVCLPYLCSASSVTIKLKYFCTDCYTKSIQMINNC